MMATNRTQHLSTYTDQAGVRVWTVLHKGSPLCAPTDRAAALLVWDRWFRGLIPEVWDGDAGSFVQLAEVTS